MRVFEQMLNTNTLADWASAAGVVLAILATILVVKRIVIRQLATYARKTTTPLDDFVSETLAATRMWLLFPLALYAAAQIVTLPVRVERLVGHITVITLLLQSAIWGNHFIHSWIRYTLQVKRSENAASASTVAIMGFVARLGLWSIVLLLALDNLGFNISALLAGLGIGGVAVALAAQNILGDLFASMSIVLDRPFEVGDFIVVSEQMGTVEYIGLKTTRLRSLSGEQIVFSNNDLLNSRIHNFKRMAERRVQFSFGVVYQTPANVLERIPAMVREIIEQQPQTRFDRAHFQSYGDSSLNFEIVYYVLDRDYNLYMDRQQAINLALFRRFESENIEFAYPTRTLYVQGNATPKSTPS